MESKIKKENPCLFVYLFEVLFMAYIVLYIIGIQITEARFETRWWRVRSIRPGRIAGRVVLTVEWGLERHHRD